MASHPYISGPGSIIQMIGFLRKNFPANVNSDTVRKFAIAPNNESYVINALQFIGVINEEGKRTPKGQDVFVLGDDAFPKAFEALIREAYKDLFEIRADAAWTLNKNELTSYFRTTDKTSEIIGGRQAGLFQAFRALAGHEQVIEKPSSNHTARPKIAKPKAATRAKSKSLDTEKQETTNSEPEARGGRRDWAMTVRIEVNLPANGSQETYDAIFKSIRSNLIND